MHSQEIMSKLKLYQEDPLIHPKGLLLKTLLLEHLSQRSANFLCKDPDSISPPSLGYAGHGVVSVATT